ncbi:MAG: glucohydrolase, partial [Dermabacter sp.]|nr:glucohydrolase [Dermabacter sp.]
RFSAGEGSDASSLIAVANFSREAVELSSDVWPEGAELVLSNVADGERAGEQKLGGWEFALLKA